MRISDVKELNKYKTWLLDCDGVLLDSNKIKSEAFYEVALPYGKDAARALVEYNKRLGGVTRFEKFKYFFETILDKNNYEKDLENALTRFGTMVCNKLISCPETKGLRRFLEGLKDNSKKFVISGGAQEELRHVFKQRGLDAYFDGIFGSPDTKEMIMSSLARSFDIAYPAVFIGDSRYDYEVAAKFEIDFIFMSKYTEFENWRSFFVDKEVAIIESLNFLSSETMKADNER
jgi:phosphoglycolate phosphatase-like HAD superfamily hydrolase